SGSASSSALGGHLAWGAWDPDGKLHLFTANADGSDERALLPDAHVEQPKWSPDGTKIAVAVDGNQVVGGVANADGSDFHRFTIEDPTLSLACVLWSPDATRLACEGWDDAHPSRTGIYTVMSTDGGGARLVSHVRGLPCGWSPDGSRLAVLREGDDEDHSPLFIVGVDGSGARQLSAMTLGLACDWSPDGRSIL